MNCLTIWLPHHSSVVSRIMLWFNVDCCNAMKIHVLLLALYILLLSCLPCGDMKDCSEVTTGRTESHATAAPDVTNHAHHDKDVEQCSPFCSCICCGQITNWRSNAIIMQPLVRVSPPKILLTAQFLQSEYTSAIWQPPKYC